MIRKIHKNSRRNYGSPRITDRLREQGYRVGHNRVARLMRKHGIQAKMVKIWKRTTQSNHTYRVAPNLVKKRFQASYPGQLWLSDITHIKTHEGWLYLVCILDVCTREIVGWSMLNRLTSDLVMNALNMAIGRHRPAPGLIFHSDRGSQYASNQVQNYLQAHGIIQSMSGKDNCYDNAMMESFFHTLKIEHVYWYDYPTRKLARTSVFDYIEVFYNRQRKHSGIGYKVPAEYGKELKLTKLNVHFFG